MQAISNDRIPNNVALSNDRQLQRALESWQPNFLHGGKTWVHAAFYLPGSIYAQP